MINMEYVLLNLRGKKRYNILENIMRDIVMNKSVNKKDVRKNIFLIQKNIVLMIQRREINLLKIIVKKVMKNLKFQNMKLMNII